MNSSSSTKVSYRKLRRGTTSCWECKRRKTRCHFEKSNSSACVSCRRRGCKCVLQHVDEQHHLDLENADQRSRDRDIGEQMAHLETLVDRLVHQPTKSNSSAQAEQTGHSQASANSRHRLLLPKLDKTPAKTPNFPLGSSFEPSLQSPKKVRMHPSMLTPDPTSGSLRCNSSILLLQSILPSIGVTTRIMHQNKLLMMSMHVFRGLSTDPFQPNHLRQILQAASSTPSSAKPVDLARSLFQLAICLQQSDRTSEISELCLDRSKNDVAGQYFEAASRYVTSQDSLVVSFEGIEALMLEGLYHVCAGQLRLAWLVFRRALGIAHLLGLHIPQRRRQGKQSGLANLHPSARPATLWFRLVFMDRYLSLVLGLPMSIGEDSFMDDFVGLEPQEQLERIQAKLTSRIISRNEQMRHGSWADELTYDHYSETKDIDYLLKQAARSFPTEWWAFPRPQDARNNAELRDMTTKIVHQLHHYNLVLLLHIPYVIPGRDSCLANAAAQEHANSRLSAMIASRELLTRSIIPIGPNRVSSSTRGNALKIILSALTLLLAHLDGHRLGYDNALDHQRPGDLLTIDRAIKTLENLAEKYDGDALCSSAAQVLKKLSAIEATAANGVAYTSWSEPSETMHMECMVQEDGEGCVTMSFPYVGTIHIARQQPQETMTTTSIGSSMAADISSLHGSLLTPSWAWSDSPFPSWPEIVSTTPSTDDAQDMILSSAFAGYGMHCTRGLRSDHVGCIDAIATSRPTLRDYGLEAWDADGQRPVMPKET